MASTNILFIGSKWWGADSRALASALRRAGGTLVEVDRLDSFPVRWQGFALKVIRKLLIPLCRRHFNQRIVDAANGRQFDFVLVCKGSHIYARTLRHLGESNVPIYNFYPDVSFKDHGKDLWQSLPHYDCVLTTKRFHLEDQDLKERLLDIQLVSHGYDVEVHRKIDVTSAAFDSYRCDVSFVGAWSPKKERILRHIIDNVEDIDISIAGPSWWRASRAVRQKWQGRSIRGDELAVQYSAAKINLGILSEAGGGTKQGDQVTTRTWHIPACCGFMLHESTMELADYFVPGEEVATYSTLDDLTSKIRRYLENPSERQRIARCGFERCISSSYSYDATAKQILDYHALK